MTDQLVQEFQKKLTQGTETLRQELGGIRTNRPATKLIEDIRVNYAEEMLTVKQLGTISVQPPRDIIVTAWDRAAGPAIAKAIQDAKIGLTPSANGNVIRMQLPALTLERREELVKLAKATAEKARIRLRADRDEAMKRVEQLAKGKEITEDQKFKLKKQMQEAVDKINREIEEMVGKKIKEISE